MVCSAIALFRFSCRQGRLETVVGGRKEGKPFHMLLHRPFFQASLYAEYVSGVHALQLPRRPFFQADYPCMTRLNVLLVQETINSAERSTPISKSS
jgi:hypothetical protein